MTDIAEELVATEKRRLRALLGNDGDTLDRLHTADYRLCNPTGTVWTKAEYLDRLSSGRLTYRRLDLVGDMDARVDTELAVLRYRCVIELRLDGKDLPVHDAWHTDVYRRGDGGEWRCFWSQATGIMDLG